MASLFRCALHSQHSSGVDIVNTWHVRTDDGALGLFDASAADVADALTDVLVTPYRACMTAAYTLLSLSATEVLPPGSTDVPDTSGNTIALAGTQTTTGDQLPVPTCLLATIYSSAAIRSGHGRIYLPGGVAASSLNASGRWDPASGTWTAAGTFLTALIAGHGWTAWLGSETIKAVVYSRTRHAANLSPYYFDASTYTRRDAPHWLRSRATAP